MSDDGISLTLTSEQVETVIADVAARAECGEPLSVVTSPRELAASRLLDDRSVSRSLLYGLMALSCLPADGGERGTKEIAQELDLPSSTAHRYIHTLRLVGLLEQNPQTRKYYRMRVGAQKPE